jgi:alcohol oxidase
MISEGDVAALRWGYKKSRELARRMGVYRGEFTPGNPKFPVGSAALCNEAIGPVAISAPDITYTPEDEKALETYNRNFGKCRCFAGGTNVSE